MTKDASASCLGLRAGAPSMHTYRHACAPTKEEAEEVSQNRNTHTDMQVAKNCAWTREEPVQKLKQPSTPRTHIHARRESPVCVHITEASSIRKQAYAHTNIRTDNTVGQFDNQKNYSKP